MSKSIEQDALKSKKRIKTAKIIAVVASVLLVAWTVYSVATNLNQKERFVVNSFIKAFTEKDEPAAFTLTDCSKIYEGQSSTGKQFRFVIAEIEKGGSKNCYLLVVDGKKEGELFAAQSLNLLDMSGKENVKLEIVERDESIHLQKMQRTLLHYWKFHDVA